MKVRVLPSITDPRSQLLITFVLNDHISLDAGALAFHLTGEELLRVKDIVLTHTHLDHIASLPFIFSEMFVDILEPIRIHATAKNIEELKAHVFNNIIWPDFTKIPNAHGPLLSFHPFELNEPFTIGELTFHPIPVNHVVETSGHIVDDGRVSVAFTSDTTITDAFWEEVNRKDNLKAIFIDVAFHNALEGVALASKHLTPKLLTDELKKLNREVELLAVNLKPSCREPVIAEIEALGLPNIHVAKLDVPYEW